MRTLTKTTYFAALSVLAAGCSSLSNDTNRPQPEPSSQATGGVSAPGAAQQVDAIQIGYEDALFRAVPAANPKSSGLVAPNAISPDCVQTVVAQGANALENPALVSIGDGRTVLLGHYGYNDDAAHLPAAGAQPAATSLVEASKTEPDKNTYLVLEGQTGADARYDYGTHFVFQGHEGGQSGYITRINLDADQAHRVTLLATADTSGHLLPLFDGSTWDPWANRLLFTSENGSAGGVWQATLDVPSTVVDLAGSIGRASYEGIQNDGDGNLWIVEDSGGSKGAVNKNAKQPNSFVYRFVPRSRHDLTRGKLQALQVLSLRTRAAIAFHAGQADADIKSDDVLDLHTYGKALDTAWVTLHDTAVDGTAAFDANALAKAKGATPFKRPENGQFRPGRGFTEFYFGETGDTDIRSEAGSAYGGFGAILKLVQRSPSSDRGTLSLVYAGDAAHSSFDNVGFLSRDVIVFVEDAGDTLHTQRNAFDSAWAFDVRKDYGNPANQPARLLAQGRDSAATVDSSFLGAPWFQNEGDNEITGFHVSNGDPTVSGVLGAQIPHAFHGGWRVFYTQQHGDNVTFEILANPNR